MDPQPEVRLREKEELGGLNEVCNGNVSGRIEAFNGLAEGTNCLDRLSLSNMFEFFFFLFQISCEASLVCSLWCDFGNS